MLGSKNLNEVLKPVKVKATSQARLFVCFCVRVCVCERECENHARCFSWAV